MMCLREDLREEREMVSKGPADTKDEWERSRCGLP